MHFAEGDTSNPFIFAKQGVKSPFGQADTLALRLLRREITFEEVVSETEQLLADCDLGHTELQVKFPKDEEARSLAVQWAILGPQLLLRVQRLRSILEHKKKPTRTDFVRVAVIFDLLDMRSMTFIKNGLISLV